MTNDILDALSACIRLSRKLLEKSALDGSMTDTELVSVGALSKPWVAGAFSINDLRQHNGLLYRCCQAHDSTANPQWTPDTVPALWTLKHTTDPKRATPFVQPTGSHDAYMRDECVTFDVSVYRSTIDNNEYSPVAYPAGWEVVTND